MFRLVNNNFLNIILIFCLFILSLIIVIYIIDKTLKLIPYLRKTANLIIKYMYIILMPFPILYLIYYYGFWKNGTDESVQFLGPETADYLKQLSLIFFSGGIFSATIKLINSLVIFKKHFKNVIISKEFDEILTKKLDILTFSNEHLLKQNNLEEIWKKVTLCKYEQKFPELMNKLKDNLENELFFENNLTCYYRNFRTQINLELLENNIVKITEISSFSIVSNSRKSFEIDFWISSNKKDQKEIYTKIVPEKCKINGVLFDDKLKEVESDVEEPNQAIKTYRFELNGNKEYHIERSVEMTQKISEDRVFSFSSSRIIDDMSIHIQYCDRLDVFFSSVGKNYFKEDNQILTGKSYINRDVLLPGEKFKIFIFKKQRIKEKKA